MNRLDPVDASERRWRLPRHAHVVVYEREGAATTGAATGPDEGGLLTIYDCGAAQKPPTAQVLGTLERVDARAEVESTPTGRVVSLREESTLERVGGRRYRIAAR